MKTFLGTDGAVISGAATGTLVWDVNVREGRSLAWTLFTQKRPVSLGEVLFGKCVSQCSRIHKVCACKSRTVCICPWISEILMTGAISKEGETLEVKEGRIGRGDRRQSNGNS